MSGQRRQIGRRGFLKIAAAAGLAGSVRSVMAAEAEADPNKPKQPQVPRRKFGRTKITIPCLSFGTYQVDVDNQILLRKTLQWGVNFWDTAYNYGGGNSEIGIGRFLAKNPKLRKKLFLVTKASGAHSVEDVEKRLTTSLKRLHTDYIDLYYGIHQCSDPKGLTKELRAWAESAKKRKLIRYFGITTHQNMAQVLAAAAKLDWIDAVMTTYNFRLMQDAKLQAAIDACHKAGIAVIAMKTQGMGQRPSTEADRKLLERFTKRGFDLGQAKIKVVLEDKRICCACVGMKNVQILNANVAAVLDKTKLTEADRQAFAEYAAATCSSYCAGCSAHCDGALPEAPYISDIMRYLMYYNSYGEKAEARRLFAQIPAQVRGRLLSLDYRPAEQRCPQRMPIAELVAEAVRKLA